MDTIQLQWLLPASVIAAMIAISVAILEKLLPKMLRIKEPVEGASYQEGKAIELKVDAFSYLARLRLRLVDPWVKWFYEGDATSIAVGIDEEAELPLGTHTITVKAPGFIPAQVTIEVVPVVVYSPLVPA